MLAPAATWPISVSSSFLCLFTSIGSVLSYDVAPLEPFDTFTPDDDDDDVLGVGFSGASPPFTNCVDDAGLATVLEAVDVRGAGFSGASPSLTNCGLDLGADTVFDVVEERVVGFSGASPSFTNCVDAGLLPVVRDDEEEDVDVRVAGFSGASPSLTNCVDEAGFVDDVRDEEDDDDDDEEVRAAGFSGASPSFTNCVDAGLLLLPLLLEPVVRHDVEDEDEYGVDARVAGLAAILGSPSSPSSRRRPNAASCWLFSAKKRLYWRLLRVVPGNAARDRADPAINWRLYGWARQVDEKH